MLIKHKLIYLFKFLASLCILFINTQYASAESTPLSLPIVSEQFSTFYAKDPTPGISEVYLLPQYQHKTRFFNSQELSISVKGDHFSSKYLNEKIRYFELGRFTIDGYLYKLIILNRDDGESDTVLLNTQLNSYNPKGKLVDSLLLDSQFAYEDIVRYADFMIHQNHTIDINNYVIYRYEEGEYGEIGKEIENPVPVIYTKEQYKIDNGVFKLISHVDFI